MNTPWLGRIRRSLILWFVLGLAGCALPEGGSVPTVLTGDYIEVAEASVRPVRISGPRPEYPPHLQRMAIRGEVAVRFIVETDGSVREIEAVNARDLSENDREFAEAAIKAIRQWKFRTGKKDGVPVRVLVQAPVRFGN